MPTFERHIAKRWHTEVPGARWFQCDFHVHTLDDHPGGRIVRPVGIDGDPSDSSTVDDFARGLLRCAIREGVEVVGLTPHAVRCGGLDAPSCVWRTVEIWNDEDDDDGVPFREKIYAVFPGFEPSLTEGKAGVHLSFLFDPEVGRDLFLTCFSTVMDGVSPWRDNNLQNSPRKTADALAALKKLFEREGVGPDYLVLAPHAFRGKGALAQMRAQVAADFPWGRLAALECSDDLLPEDELRDREWLVKGQRTFRHALVHGSDCYDFSDDAPEQSRIGHRRTMVKLALPRIAAVRQAFLAYDSRTLCPYVKTEQGRLVLRGDLPDPLGGEQPWIRSVSVSGGASFFGGASESSGQPRKTVFELNPGLTCVIGGRMTGKSTLLDGLRVFTDRSLPVDARVRSDVKARAKQQFLAGKPTLELNYAGASAGDGDWPARFFTQRELRDAAEDQEGIREILFGLVPEKVDVLSILVEKLEELDSHLGRLAAKIDEARAAAVDAAQAQSDAEAAKDALDRFEAVGAVRIGEIQADRGRIETRYEAFETMNREVAGLRQRLDALSSPLDLDKLDLSEPVPEELEKAEASVGAALDALSSALSATTSALEKARTQAVEEEERLTADVTGKLVEQGGSREDLIAFEKHRMLASSLESARAIATIATSELADAETRFAALERERDEVLDDLRKHVEDLTEAVNSQFDGQIRVRVVRQGVSHPMEKWVLEQAQRGITRWWNNRKEADPETLPGAAAFRKAFEADDLASLGVSGDVAATIESVLEGDGLYRLRALRSPDLYVLEFRVSDNPEVFKRLEDLSGGKQVSVLLSLLLSMDDDRPLVVDQPEDELDKAYLFETVLPLLRSLKGKRQIIFATHDANITVNGDADQVICLEADHEKGWVATAGAIEDEAVRNAVMLVLDGGDEAFELRRAKYGF